jgi:hypothetical protein
LDAFLDEDAINTAGTAAAELAQWAGERERHRVRSASHPDHGPDHVRAAADGAEQAVGREHCDLLRDIAGNPFRPVRFDPAWRSVLAVGLATGIYDTHDFDRLPILADALEDAGCSDADLLAHLRSPGPHVRGCWAVDLVLGKE